MLATKKVNMTWEFFDILKNKRIESYFQPIISLKDGKVIGYEALSRGPIDSPLHYPNELFHYGKKLNKIWELDLLCRLKAIEKAKGALGDKFLFINIDPNIVKDPEFKKGFTKEFLEKNDLSPKNIIFEITEHTAVVDYKSFNEILENYRSQGYRVAVDDVGDGYSGLRLLSEIRPNFIKIDMELIREIDKDMIKRELLKSFQRFSEITNIQLIAEGIETYEELKTLIEIGIQNGQGYFLQRPQREFTSLGENIIEVIKEINQLTRKVYQEQQTIPIANFARRDKPLNMMDKCKDVHLLLSEKYNLQGIVVVDKNIPHGLIMRNKFYLQMLKYGDQEAFLSKPITDVMDSSPLIIEGVNSLRDTISMTITREEGKVYDYVIVNHRGEYLGVIPVALLLDVINNIC